MRVAIIGMGPTKQAWFDRVYYPKIQEQHNQRAFDVLSEAVIKSLPYNDQTLQMVVQLSGQIGSVPDHPEDYDEVWVINNLACLLRHYDKVFHMDDLSSSRAHNIPKDVTVITSKAVEGYTCEEYPITEIVGKYNSLYFNNTIAYAIAYAMLKKFKHIGLFGCDFVPHTGVDAHESDSGASCTEYWMREAENQGITFEIPVGCRLRGMDTDQRLYGYKEQPAINLEDKILQFDKGWHVTPLPKLTGSKKPRKRKKTAKVSKKPVRSLKAAE